MKFQKIFYAIIIMILFFSGEMRVYNQILGERTAIILFVFTCFLFHLCINRSKIQLDHYNGIVMIFLTIWVFISSYILNNDSISWKGTIICLNIISIGLLSSAVTFSNFREGILKVSTIIAFVSIIVQVGHDLGYIHAYPANLTHAVSPRSLYLFNTEWGEQRLASIYWEPGQYQIVLTYVLCLFADELSKLSNWKGILKKFGIILLAFIMTKSTTGYIVFGIICLTVFSDILFKSKNFYIAVFSIAIGYVILLSLYKSDVIQSKIEQSENPYAVSSYSIRLADNLALLECIKDKPITGWGPDSKSLNESLYSRGSLTNSNGVLYAAAELGIPYVMLWCIFLFKGVKRLFGNRLAIGLTIALFLSQMNEVGYALPIVYIYLFKFRKKHEENISNNNML